MIASGIVQTAFQNEPYPIFWAVRADGQLLGLVFNRQDEVYAWFRISMECAAIESVAVISGLNQEDMVVIEVNRIVNNTSVRYVEFFYPQELFNDLANAFFVNAGKKMAYNPALPITAITNANPCVVTAPRHTYANGDFVQIVGCGTNPTIGNPTGTGMWQIDQDKTQAYIVANTNPGAGTFELAGMDSTLFGVYGGSGGTVMQVTNQVTGMTYLMGKQVVAVGDGTLILPPGTTVTSDTLTFMYYCNQIVVGLPFTTTIQPSNPVISTPTHTTRGMKQKLDRVTLSLWQSMGGQFGTDLAHMYDIVYGPGTQGQQPEMSTSEYTRDLDANWDDASTFFIRQSDPFPFTLRGLVMRMSYNAD